MNNETEPNVIREVVQKTLQDGKVDELLGSVSCCDTEGEGKTRTSARVYKKMKFDSNVTDKKVDKKDDAKSEESKVENRKTPNPLWSPEEKKMFFEALNEYGKDFKNIHSYISARLKKKGTNDELIKTKYQIMHFYYKTFHFISNYITFSDRMPKIAQELYALINYGEIRRKVGSVTQNKAYTKISDLVYNGNIAVKSKGKTIKIKTPMCKALRRLNKLDEKYDDLKLPTRVIVELHPKNMASFLKVQSTAQNPRVRMSLPLQKRLSSLISCITNRWKSIEALIYEKATSTNPLPQDCITIENEIKENHALLTPLIRLQPPPNAHIELPTFDMGEYFTRQSICLNAYEARMGVKNEIKKEEIKDELKTENKQQPLNKVDIVVTSVEQFVDNAVDNYLFNDFNEIIENDVEVKKVEKPAPEVRKQEIEQVKSGWTLANCGCITIGEIYLMCGSDSKLILEYDLKDLEIKREQNEQNDENSIISEDNKLSYSLKKLLSVAKLESQRTESKCSNCSSSSSSSTRQFKKPQPPPRLKQNGHHDENEADTLDSKINQLNPDMFFHNQNSKMIHLLTQIDAVQRMNTKFRNKRGGRGSRSRQLVVERNLVPNKSEANNHQIVTVNIVPQANEQTNKEEEEEEGEEADVDVNNEENGKCDANGTENELLRLDYNDDSDDEVDFRGLLSGTSSPYPASISKLLRENENHWMYADSDYSLSSLLGQLEQNRSTTPANEDTTLSQDVDAQLSKLLVETSVDFTANFADLAARVVDNKN